ncbi:hypothetical protein R5O87_04455 [Arthrobacter globiformis]
MYDEPSFLFDIDESAPSSNVLAPLPIKPGQIEEIRAAFEEAGVSSQDERRALIESVVVREVASLRELKAVEVRRILQRITGVRGRNLTATGSAWDNREEDTWIDKL